MHMFTLLRLILFVFDSVDGTRGGGSSNRHMSDDQLAATLSSLRIGGTEVRHRIQLL